MAATKQVVISDKGFSPSPLTIAVGDAVEWKNQGKHVHKLVFDSPGQGSSPDLSPGGAHSQKFNQAGTFPYHCEKHPGMKGEIVVS